MKGFNLSEDYDLLWDLIQNDYRIPAWIIYNDEYEEPIYDLVEVKMSKSKNEYLIGSRGSHYSGIDDGYDGFLMVCKAKDLKFLIPDYE